MVNIYIIPLPGQDWDASRLMCNSNGGEMIIIINSIENEFYKNLVFNFIPNNEWWIGFYQDLNDPNYSEPKVVGNGSMGLILIMTPWGTLDNNFNGTESLG